MTKAFTAVDDDGTPGRLWRQDLRTVRIPSSVGFTMPKKDSLPSGRTPLRHRTCGNAG
jgi:hypothetical protein